MPMEWQRTRKTSLPSASAYSALPSTAARKEARVSSAKRTNPGAASCTRRIVSASRGREIPPGTANTGWTVRPPMAAMRSRACLRTERMRPPRSLPTRARTPSTLRSGAGARGPA